MARACPGISIRDLHRLLARWGCDHVRDKGGHSIWRGPNGAMIVVPVPGRSIRPTFDQIRNAAAAVGVPISEFTAGPKKGSRP